MLEPKDEAGYSRNPALRGRFTLMTMSPLLLLSIWNSHAQLTILSGEGEGENRG